MAKNKHKGGKYTSVDMPEPDGHSTYHKPRRNYWGNLFDEDTYNEEISISQNYDYSDYDPEDDHSSYYDNDNYD